MKINVFIICFVISFLCTGIFSQFKLKLKENNQTISLNSIKNENTKPFSKTSNVIPLTYYALLFINPMLVIEDKKAYFGLTKEISLAYYPAGRLAFEYSYIFRSFNTSHLRFSYNYDIVLESRDFFALILSPGAGYFTDTKNKGWFGHASFGFIIPMGFAVTNPYVRYRHTFIQNKPEGKTDIDDISLGMGLVFYLNQ